MSEIFSNNRLVDFFWMMEVEPVKVDLDTLEKAFEQPHTSQIPVPMEPEYKLTYSLPSKPRPGSCPITLNGMKYVLK